LQVFYAEAGVSLRWQPVEDLAVPLPTADVLLQEDGFEGPVDRKGHGLQRAFILTLLQHLAKAAAEEQSRQSDDDPVPPAANEDVPAEVQEHAREERVMPGLILAIEEPELYQHPTKQRHFAKVLTQLISGAVPGIAAQTQIIFASHSSLFVSMNRFDEVRLARRRRTAGQEHKECQLTSSNLEPLHSALRKRGAGRQAPLRQRV
jgi:hypothetical protein